MAEPNYNLNRLRGVAKIDQARTGKDTGMVVWGVRVKDLNALLDIAEQVQKCIEDEPYIAGDADVFWMQWAKLREMVGELTEDEK